MSLHYFIKFSASRRAFIILYVQFISSFLAIFIMFSLFQRETDSPEDPRLWTQTHMNAASSGKIPNPSIAALTPPRIDDPFEKNIDAKGPGKTFVIFGTRRLFVILHVLGLCLVCISNVFVIVHVLLGFCLVFLSSL